MLARQPLAIAAALDASPAPPSRSGWRPTRPFVAAASRTAPSKSGRSGSRTRRTFPDDHASRFSLHAKPSSSRTRSRANLGGEAQHYRRASSSCGSGKKRASAWYDANSQDSRRESVSPICATTSRVGPLLDPAPLYTGLRCWSASRPLCPETGKNGVLATSCSAVDTGKPAVNDIGEAALGLAPGQDGPRATTANRPMSKGQDHAIAGNSECCGILAH